jgi:hypothetical protein
MSEIDEKIWSSVQLKLQKTTKEERMSPQKNLDDRKKATRQLSTRLQTFLSIPGMRGELGKEETILWALSTRMYKRPNFYLACAEQSETALKEQDNPFSRICLLLKPFTKMAVLKDFTLILMYYSKWVSKFDSITEPVEIISINGKRTLELISLVFKYYRDAVEEGAEKEEIISRTTKTSLGVRKVPDYVINKKTGKEVLIIKKLEDFKFQRDFLTITYKEPGYKPGHNCSKINVLILNLWMKNIFKDQIETIRSSVNNIIRINISQIFNLQTTTPGPWTKDLISRFMTLYRKVCFSDEFDEEILNERILAVENIINNIDDEIALPEISDSEESSSEEESSITDEQKRAIAKAKAKAERRAQRANRSPQAADARNISYVNPNKELIPLAQQPPLPNSPAAKLIEAQKASPDKDITKPPPLRQTSLKDSRQIYQDFMTLKEEERRLFIKSLLAGKDDGFYQLNIKGEIESGGQIPDAAKFPIYAKKADRVGLVPAQQVSEINEGKAPPKKNGGRK